MASQREVNRILKRASILALLSTGGDEVHRLQVHTERPAAGRGVRVVNTVGEAVGSLRMNWSLTPDSFDATQSQVLAIPDSSIEFPDGAGSGFTFSGHGRTFPMKAAGVFAGAVAQVSEGRGRLEGLAGCVTMSGRLQAPGALSVALFSRFLDPEGRLSAAAISAPREIVNPDPDLATLMFLGETNPDVPATVRVAPDGTMAGSNVHECFRLVETDFDVRGTAGIGSITEEGPVVGFLDATLWFNPLSPSPVVTTTNGVFRFIDRFRREFATLRANLTDGSACRTAVEGAPEQLFRMGGFGPIQGGTGQFEGALGLMSLNGVVSVAPWTQSNLYVFRIYDPSGNFRTAARRAWSA